RNRVHEYPRRRGEGQQRPCAHVRGELVSHSLGEDSSEPDQGRDRGSESGSIARTTVVLEPCNPFPGRLLRNRMRRTSFVVALLCLAGPLASGVRTAYA